jgi:transposase InsO family protein
MAQTAPTEHRIFQEQGNGDLVPEKTLAATFRVKNAKKANLSRYNGLIMIPEDPKEEYIREQHGLPAHGHQGVHKTYERITRTHNAPGLRKRIEKVISECQQCTTSNPVRHKPVGMLQQIRVPDRAWQSVSMDFIVKLPKSKEPMTGIEFDSILVIIERLTRYGIFVPYKEASTAEDLAYAINKTVIANYGLPEEWITDRDKLFTSKFWQTLMSLLGSKIKLSTSYHPQTDGITERLNQTVEIYLRKYLDDQQDDWVVYLPTAQFAYNSSNHTTTGISPHFATYGRHPTAYHQEREAKHISQAASIAVGQLKGLHDSLKNDIQTAHEVAAKYYDNSHLERPRFQEGDMVYINRKNIKTTRPSNKLDHVKIGPFPISAVLGDVTYKVRLPKHMKIHPVFHAALLEPAKGKHQRAVAPKLARDQEQVEYDVERIQLFCETCGVSPLEPGSAGPTAKAAREASLPGSR